MECCTLTVHDRGSLKSFRGDSGKREAWWFCIFLRQTTRKEGSNFWGDGWDMGCGLLRNYVMVVILLSLLFNYDNLIFKLHQKNVAYLDEGWLFIGRFKVGSVPGMSVVLVASKVKVSKSMSMMQGH